MREYEKIYIRYIDFGYAYGHQLMQCRYCKKPEIPEYNLEVTHEKFEDMPVVNSDNSIYGFENESEMYDSCDYVVVGMLKDTFTDGVPKRYGLYGQEVQEGSGEMAASVATLRELTVLEVLKGDNVGGNYNIC